MPAGYELQALADFVLVNTRSSPDRTNRNTIRARCRQGCRARMRSANTVQPARALFSSDSHIRGGFQAESLPRGKENFPRHLGRRAPTRLRWATDNAPRTRR